MALPMASTPRYKLTIPSMKKQVTYRPFLVKEEKALMVAQQSEDQEVMVTTLKGVIQSCVLDKIDVDDLAVFDIEYIFTQLRARSVGEIVELILKCDTCDDQKATVKYNIDLSKLAVEVPEGHEKKIVLFDDVGVIMKYPSLEVLKKIENVGKDIEAVFDIIASCIEFIYNNDEMFATKEVKQEEVKEFINNLTQEQFQKLQKFFETMPKLEQKVKYKCPLCTKDHEKVIRGLDSFF